MTEKTQALEVFQELYLRHPQGAVAVRAAVLANLDNGWSHEPEREEKSAALGNDDMLALERAATPNLPGVSLWMFSAKDASYKVSNIVPSKSGELGVAGYNAALQHFIQSVIQPASESTPLTFEVTGALQSIEDWAGDACAKALKTFSSLANKSTGRTHPMDEKRWLLFLLVAHREKSTLESDRLARWLIETESWPLEIAYELASEYDLSRTLLKLYDQTR
ncbi:hypothetical protein [Roseateles sp. LYH14W]|uniref:Uncharacterized protein n=1 Tax=Pelomonas parva TaxID=3299032 RepID=A0ABW7FES7_9BURK